MPTNERGHTVPAATGVAPSRAQIFEDLANSINDVILCDDVADQAAKVAALGYTPSVTRPILTWRADAAAGRQLEVSTDGGVTFHPYQAESVDQAWTPTWNNLSVGNGTVTSRCNRRDGWVDAAIKLVFGSTTAVTGGVSLAGPESSTVDEIAISNVVIIDASTSNRQLRRARVTAGGTIIPQNDDGSTLIGGSTVPWTWATGDTIAIAVRYPYV